MRQILETGLTAQHNMMPAICDATGGMRALTCEEIEQVSGGVLPVIVAVAQWGGAIAGGVFVTKAASDFYDWLFSDPELSCSM